MRIAYLAAGAAGMYCGSCLHDNTLAAALLKLGEDVTLAPIYTPLRTDEVDVSIDRVFYGGVNAYLQQKSALFRRTPRWLDGWLDHPRVLQLISGRASSVDAALLGGMTVSMLQGEHGRQQKELRKLVDWLARDVRPEVVHLSNSMMLGLARTIGERCGAPVVCTLSGEDVFLEKLVPPYYEEARELLRERAADAAAFVAMNEYYADFMAGYLNVDRGRVRVIPHGLNLEGCAAGVAKGASAPLRIGFMARICPEKGLHLLVEACELLAERGDAPPFELHAAGYLGAGERAYYDELRRRAEQGALAGRFTYHGELDRAAKFAFLQSLDVMSLPTVYRESKGLSAYEALACGVPLALAEHGAFPELIAATGGGVLHAPNDARDLAGKLAVLLGDAGLRAELGSAGQRAVRERFHARAMAEQTLELYRLVAGGRGGRSD